MGLSQIATQPIITADQAATIDGEFVDRFRCLLSVDEIVRDVVDLLEAQGQLDSTYIFFTSDHGCVVFSHPFSRLLSALMVSP